MHPTRCAPPTTTTDRSSSASAAEGVPSVYPLDHRSEIGRAARLTEGGDVTLIAHGPMVSRALEAAELLAGDGVGARVVSMPTVKPLDVERMRNPWNTLRCRLTFHRWETFRDGAEKGVQCRDCKRRELPMKPLPAKESSGAGAGSAAFVS
jgi:Transketolase, C-terminal domain